MALKLKPHYKNASAIGRIRNLKFSHGNFEWKMGRESRFGASGALVRPPEAGSDSTLLESRFHFPPVCRNPAVSHAFTADCVITSWYHTHYTHIPALDGCAVEARLHIQPGANTLISAYQPPYAPCTVPLFGIYAICSLLHRETNLTLLILRGQKKKFNFDQITGNLFIYIIKIDEVPMILNFVSLGYWKVES